MSEQINWKTGDPIDDNNYEYPPLNPISTKIIIESIGNLYEGLDRVAEVSRDVYNLLDSNDPKKTPLDGNQYPN